MLSKSVGETHEFARKFVAGLKPKEAGATVVGLVGDLGAGKTTFMQGVAEALGISENITSPTFVLQKRYQLSGTSYKQLVHMDAYRLENEKELSALGWREMLEDSANLIFVEWADNIPAALPKDAEILKFSFVDDTTRIIEKA